MTDIRQEVRARIIETMAAARSHGIDDIAAARRAFPGTPDSVLWACWADLDAAAEEAWWHSIEKTIDGEIVERALAAPVRRDTP